MPDPTKTAAISAALAKAKAAVDQNQSQFEYLRGVTENCARILEIIKNQLDFRMEHQFVKNQICELDMQEKEIAMRKQAPSSNQNVRQNSIAEDARAEKDIAFRRYNLESQCRILEAKIIRKDDIQQLIDFLEASFRIYPNINLANDPPDKEVTENGESSGEAE